MRKVILLAIIATFSTTIWAQNVREELISDYDKAGSNYYAYPGPSKQLTPAPKGKKPFYISHYGRHGSRHLIHHREYDYPYTTLLYADKIGKLSEKGKTVLIKVLLNEDEATLPIKTDCAPYYHWKDFKNFCLEKLANYKK